MNPKAEALKRRTHDVFVRVIGFCDTIPVSVAGASIARQLVDAAGSTDSNYGAATKGRTRRQFIDKVGIAAEEADEARRWLEALRDAGLGDREEVTALIKEADELTAILVASHKDRQTAARRSATAGKRRASRPQSPFANPLIPIDDRRSVNRRSPIVNPLIDDRRSAIGNLQELQPIAAAAARRVRRPVARERGVARARPVRLMDVRHSGRYSAR
jgi:four helix bundle protein